MTYRIALSSFVDQAARDEAAAAQATATAAQTSASTANAAAAAALSAAGDAAAAAANALAVGSSRNHVFVMGTAPGAPSQTVVLDDLWIDPANGNRVKSWDGSAWQPVPFGTAAIAAAAVTADLIAAGAIGAGAIAAGAVQAGHIAAGAIQAGAIAAGAIQAGAIAAGAIDGQTITGSTVRTAAAGQRVQLDAAGLHGYNSAGAEQTTIRASDGGLFATNATITGDLATGPASTQRVRMYEDNPSGTGLGYRGHVDFEDGHGNKGALTSTLTGQSGTLAGGQVQLSYSYTSAVAGTVAGITPQVAASVTDDLAGHVTSRLQLSADTVALNSTGNVPALAPSGAMPAGAVPLIRTASSVSVPTNASAFATVTFPSAFPNGCLAVVACPGGTAGNLDALQVMTQTASGFTVRAVNPSGALITNAASVQVSFIAVGW